jgi:hypothetical protein
MKKTLLLLAAAILTLSLTAPAFADDVPWLHGHLTTSGR